VGMWMMHSIPGVRTCWWFSMSLGAKITILCYTFGLNRAHQVPLVYHHFPHWNWSLKVRLIFLDKLMFFPRGLFEAFFFVCVYVCVSSSCVHQTSNLRNTQLASVQVLSPVATSLQPKCCLQPGCGFTQWESSFHQKKFRGRNFRVTDFWNVRERVSQRKS
jgi:hypothetical protein